MTTFISQMVTVGIFISVIFIIGDWLISFLKMFHLTRGGLKI